MSSSRKCGGTEACQTASNKNEQIRCMALDIFEFVAQLKRAVWNVGADEYVVQKVFL